MSNLTIIKMNFARKNNDVNKYFKSKGNMYHTLICTLCQNQQDFDVSLAEAKEKAYDAGWRKGKDDDNVEYCVCPECVAENETDSRDNKHYTEMNSYGE